MQRIQQVRVLVVGMVIVLFLLLFTIPLDVIRAAWQTYIIPVGVMESAEGLEGAEGLENRESLASSENLAGTENGENIAITWTHLSSATGDLEPPSNSVEQTSSLILDIDQDGLLDFVIASRGRPGPSLVWYQRTDAGWTKYLIESDVLPIEAGGAFHDIDGDGDLDIVMGGDISSNKVWWWENPYPNYSPDQRWARREIKASGENKHHDQIFGDFTGNGVAELIVWNQQGKKLILAEIPADPRTTEPWPQREIYSWSSGPTHEGLAKADIDGDGIVDIIGGGRWFKFDGNESFTPNIIDDSQRFSRAVAGQLIPGGRPEVVFVAGDTVGRLKWYEWDGSSWIGRDLLGFDVNHGHSLEIADINGNGHLDIFVAEMRLNDKNPDAKMWIFYGDGAGNFQTTVIGTGYDNHESKLGDLDGDGDLDILGKPYNWETPRVDIWLNESGNGSDAEPFAHWERHVIDAERPWQAIFVAAADIDGDGHKDLISGAWWYRNPGTAAGSWERHLIGAPLNNMALVYDFDGDGAPDILGTAGRGSTANSTLLWAHNDGEGNFTILNNIEAAQGDFLQGAVAGQFQAGGPTEVYLSWHQAGQGVQQLVVTEPPWEGTWSWEVASPISQDEELSMGDIDGDGLVDLLLGTVWLRNDGSSWTPFTLHQTNESPDRNRLADINQDGKLDAVVGYESINRPGKLAWYNQPDTPTDLWTEHMIDSVLIGPMSLDVADMDGDGDLDIIVGEHNKGTPAQASLYIYENLDGAGTSWAKHLVYTGDEHHDGAQTVDIDGDGDLDIISIGWTHGRVLLYENRRLLPNNPNIPDEPGGPDDPEAPCDPAAQIEPETPEISEEPNSTEEIDQQQIPYRSFLPSILSNLSIPSPNYEELRLGGE